MTIDDDHAQPRYRSSSEDGTTIEHFCKKNPTTHVDGFLVSKRKRAALHVI